jgi:hypothetical protein
MSATTTAIEPMDSVIEQSGAYTSIAPEKSGRSAGHPGLFRIFFAGLLIGAVIFIFAGLGEGLWL